MSVPTIVYSNNGFNGSPSLEMNTIAPAVPATVSGGGNAGPKDISYAVEKFENAHITLFQAARDGRLDIVKKKLARSKVQAMINNKDKDNTTALHYAVRFNHIEIVKYLIKKGASPIFPGEDGATPIHFAARYKPQNVLRQSKSGTFLPEEENVVHTSQQMFIGNPLEVQGAPDMPDGGSDGNGPDSESLITILMKKSSGNINIQDNYGSTPLHYAAQKGNLGAVEEMLKFGKIDVNARDKQRATPLHEACTQGNPEVAKLLIREGAELQSRDGEGMTPIHYAAMSEKVDCVKCIVDAAETAGGLEFVQRIIAERDREGQSALHIAVDAHARKTAQYLLIKGAQVNAVRVNMATPLHLAAASKDIETVELLLNFRANVEARNIYHETPLHKAAMMDTVPIIKLLLEKGANIESRDKDKYTPLLVAVSQGNAAAVTALLKAKANILAKDSNDKSSLYIAAEENCTSVLDILPAKEPCAKQSPNESDKSENTPLHVVPAEENCMSVLDILLNDPCAKQLLNESDKYENTPLHVAAKKGYVKVAKALLKKEADIDAVNLWEQTALHLAAFHGKENIVRVLLEADGTIINDEDAESNTALHLAAMSGHYRVIELLLDKGGLIDARNLLYWTPLDCAARQGWTKSAQVLLEYDAPVDPIDKCRVTPLHLASSSGHVGMVQLLMRYHADISLQDSTGRNALDMAIDEGHKPCAFAILEHEDWRKAMRNRSLERGVITTPLRKMIIKEPEVAKVVFNKCTKLSEHSADSHELTINLDYELLEDIYHKWGTDSNDTISIASDTISLGGGDSLYSFGPENELSEYKSVEFTPEEEIVRRLEKKTNHPLMLMVRHGRESLITHPLVVFLLDNKWTAFGRKIFYLKLLLFVLFLTFLTGYTIMVTKSAPKLVTTVVNGTTQVKSCQTVGQEESLAFDIFVDVGRYVLLIGACLHLLFELFQMAYERMQYLMDYTNFFEVVTYLATLIYVSADFDLSFLSTSAILSDSSCSQWRVNVGALAVFLAWIVLVLFTRKFPMFGIYIVMFEDILGTFMRFSVILALFTVAFGLAFYTMFFNIWGSFHTPAASLLKTFVMVIGEFEFDSGFNESESPPAFAYVLFILFIIVMTILLMNLLVGLAVDDIKEVMAQATLKRQTMLVDLALNVEKAFPSFLRRRMVCDHEVRHPNWLRERIFTSLDGESIRTYLRREMTPLEKVQGSQEEVKETVRKLKTSVTVLGERTAKIETMLSALVVHLEVKVDEDEIDNEVDEKL